MGIHVSRAKVALWLAWMCVAGATLIGPHGSLTAGVMLIAAGGLLGVAARWGVVSEYNGWRGQPRLLDRQVRLLSALVRLLAVGFALMGATILAFA